MEINDEVKTALVQAAFMATLIYKSGLEMELTSGEAMTLVSILMPILMKQ